MDNTKVYVNTFAEGARTTEPEMITRDNVQALMRTWKRSLTIAHYKLYGLETVGTGASAKTLLMGDIGVAKVMLPTDPAFSFLSIGQDPTRLLEHWISAVIEAVDFQDADHPVIVLNRAKALSRMREINVRRVQPGERVFAVIQGYRRGGYQMNVGGYEAIMPKAFYDWDYAESGQIGDGFYVQVLEAKDRRLRVSRRALMENPLEQARLRITRGMIVRARVTHSYHGMQKGEVRPGVKIRIESTHKRQLLQVGDEVSVRVLGCNQREFYGVRV